MKIGEQLVGKRVKSTRVCSVIEPGEICEVKQDINGTCYIEKENDKCFHIESWEVVD